MLKLNNKGFTIVEVLVCFVLISVVMMTLFSTISAFNEKRIQESYRAKIYEYKNSLTNTIQSDLIKKGLTYASVTKTGTSATGITHTLEMNLKNGERRKLIIYQRYTRTHRRIDGIPDQDDEFYIEYGTDDEMIREEFPFMGELYGSYDTSLNEFVVDRKAKACGENTRPCVLKNFQINNVAISISNEKDPAQSGHILSIYIGFYHPDLGTKYAISIVCPIDYQPGMADANANFPTTASAANSTTAIYYK